MQSNSSIPDKRNYLGKYILAPALTAKKNERKRETILDKCKEELKGEIYEIKRKKQLNYIKKEHKNNYKNLTNNEIDWIASVTIYRLKDYRNEKSKKTLFKAQHDKYFIKNKVWEKVMQEIKQEKNRSYRKNYGNMNHLNCVFCKEKIETIKHMAKNCIMIEERRLEIDEDIKNLIKEAIFLSKGENEELFKFANRKLKLINKDENKKNRSSLKKRKKKKQILEMKKERKEK